MIIKELNNGLVNSQFTSNKLFSIDSLSPVPIKSRYDSCIHIAFFVRALISNLFFSLLSLPLLVFFGSSFNHLFIIIVRRSFVCSIDQHSWEIELYVEILSSYCARVYYGNNPLCLHEYDVIPHTTQVMKHCWLSFPFSMFTFSYFFDRNIESINTFR